MRGAEGMYLCSKWAERGKTRSDVSHAWETLERRMHSRLGMMKVILQKNKKDSIFEISRLTKKEACQEMVLMMMTLIKRRMR